MWSCAQVWTCQDADIVWGRIILPAAMFTTTHSFSIRIKSCGNLIKRQEGWHRPVVKPLNSHLALDTEEKCLNTSDHAKTNRKEQLRSLLITIVNGMRNASMALSHLFDVIINESTDSNINVALLFQRQQDRWSSAEKKKKRKKEMDDREDR